MSTTSTRPQNITAQNDNNYQYDAIGNPVKDQQSLIVNIDWNVYGNIRTITKSDSTKFRYAYVASANRISKTVGAVTGPLVATRKFLLPAKVFWLPLAILLVLLLVAAMINQAFTRGYVLY